MLLCWLLGIALILAAGAGFNRQRRLNRGNARHMKALEFITEYQDNVRRDFIKYAQNLADYTRTKAVRTEDHGSIAFTFYTDLEAKISVAVIALDWNWKASSHSVEANEFNLNAGKVRFLVHGGSAISVSIPFHQMADAFYELKLILKDNKRP